MSAGFDFRDETFWGTNGAIEAYLEALAGQATDPSEPLAEFFRRGREQFYTGAIVFLDEVLTTPERCGQFVRRLDAATEQLLHENAFTDYGRQWVEITIAELRRRVAEAATAG